MSETQKFDFGDSSVANGYDTILVPILFKPWALKLVNEYGPWTNLQVLDLATGTGIVAQLVAKQVGPTGKVIGADINSEMLTLAKKRCANKSLSVDFIECSADALKIPNDSIHIVVCQQGFQFFPKKLVAAREIYRVLNNEGKVVITTWRPVNECQFFGAICNALDEVGESEIANLMRIPFDFMPESELIAPFESSGFTNVTLKQLKKDLIIEDGIEHAVKLAYATPIGPKLKELPKEKQAQFQKILTNYINKISPDGITMGRMVANVLFAEKSA